jgi:hypothetical protein
MSLFEGFATNTFVDGDVTVAASSVACVSSEEIIPDSLGSSITSTTFLLLEAVDDRWNAEAASDLHRETWY